MNLRRPRPAPTRPRLVLLAAVLLLAQWLALAHSVVHQPGGGADLAHARAATAVGAGLAFSVADLVGGHEAGGATCVVFDQLSGPAPTPAAQALPALPPPCPAALHAHAPLRVAALWGVALARAPPARG